MQSGATELNGQHLAHRTLGLDVTFQPNVDEPIHRWFKYTEGFSGRFVRKVLDEYSIRPGQVVLDPFGGCGTTAVEATISGVDSISVDVNPFMCFVAKSKTGLSVGAKRFQAAMTPLLRDLSSRPDQVQDGNSRLTAGAETIPQQEVPLYESLLELGYFSPAVLRKLLAIKALILEVRDPDVRRLMFLGLASILIPTSNLRRGPDLAFRDRPIEEAPVYGRFREVLLRMYDDLQTIDETSLGESNVILDDVRRLECFRREVADLVITSPPYLNGTNYIRNTKLELLFFGYLRHIRDLRHLHHRQMRAGINAVTSEDASASRIDSVQSLVREMGESYDQRIPRMVSSYFDDVSVALSNVARAMTREASCVYVVGDSYFGGVHIPTDLITQEIAEDVGLSPEDRITARPRKSRSGYPLRESVLVFSKAK